MQDDLNRLKQFESMLKAILMAEYGEFLPEDKISLLNAKNYAEMNYNNSLSESENNGKVVRDMMKDMMNIQCTKEITLENGETLNINYGEDLEDALIEYYSRNLSQKYGFDINEIPELKDDLETIKLLNEKLDGTLDRSVFNSDAIELLKKADFKELIEKCDKEALQKHLEKNKDIAAGLNQNENKEKQNDIMKENTERENSVQLVWLDGKKYIKYIDNGGKVSLTEVLDNGETEEFYKQKLANLKPGEKLDPERFKHELDEYRKQITLTKTEDVNPDNLNHKEINMLNFILTNREIRKEAKKDAITNSNDMKIHVVESTNDIVVTEDKDYHVDAHIVKDGHAQAESESMQDKVNISSRILTKEEYQQLVQRWSKGEELTLDELESLKRTSEAFVQNGQTIDDVLGKEEEEKTGQVLSPYEKNHYYGFGFKNILSLIITIGAIYILIIAIYLFITSLK